MNFKEAILGSGISSYIYFKSTSEKATVFSSKKSLTIKSKNFYEFNTIGGNSNIWGGYINYDRHQKFLKNTKYKNFINKKFFKIKEIFTGLKHFENTNCIVDEKDKIFRVNEYHFKNRLKSEEIKKILVNNKNLSLISDNGDYQTDKLVLCVGNLGLIKLMYNSEWLNKKDIISFEDGNCGYTLNLSNDFNKNYYIPMPISKILEKLIYKKSIKYRLSKNFLVLQKFSKSSNIHSFDCNEILKMKSSKIRFFLSNHIVNLRINNLPIRKFIKQKSDKINVFCSGTVKKYLAGPVIQDLILDIVENK